MIKMSYAPFVHSNISLSSIYKNLIIGILPLSIYCMILDNSRILVALVAFAGFMSAGIINNIFICKTIKIKVRLLKYIIYSLFFSILVADVSSVAQEFILVVAAGIIEESVFNLPSGGFFPAYILAWVFHYATNQAMDIHFKVVEMCLICVGGIYILIKRNNTVFSVIGFMLSMMVTVIYVKEITLNIFVSALFVIFLVSGSPGIMPKSKIARVIYGFLVGIAIAHFGLCGFFIIMMLTPVLDML